MNVPEDNIREVNIREYNRQAWDREVTKGNPWSLPVGPEVIAATRAGTWEIVLTPTRPVPASWFPRLEGCRVLCLASGGGQQGPILAAAGARVTVFDNSPRQLEQDRFVADREGLVLETVEGDMADLSMFADGAFDLIVHPCSNIFVPEIRPVWREAFRVLRAGGSMLSGFTNPVILTFDPELEAKGILQVRYPVPYSDLLSLTDDERRRYTDAGEPLAFGHTLEDQLGGQLDAGFLIAGLYEDRWASEQQLIARYMPGFMATRAVKPRDGNP